MKNVFNTFVKVRSIGDCWSFSIGNLRRQTGAGQLLV